MALHRYRDFLITFAFRIRSFLDKEPEVFRTILKYDNNNTRITEATKLTPDRRGH